MFEMGQPFLSTDTHTHCKINGNCFLINKGGLMFEYRQFPIVWCTKSNLNVNSVQSKHFLGVSKWRIIQKPLSNEWIWALKWVAQRMTAIFTWKLWVLSSRSTVTKNHHLIYFVQKYVQKALIEAAIIRSNRKGINSYSDTVKQEESKSPTFEFFFTWNRILAKSNIENWCYKKKKNGEKWIYGKYLTISCRLHILWSCNFFQARLKIIHRELC